MGMRERIEKELLDLPKKFIIGLIVSHEKYEEVNFHLLDILTNKKKYKGCYITINQPHEHLIRLLDMNHISHKDIFFIDCISRHIGGNVEIKENCFFVDSPQNLTDIGIAIHEVLLKIGSHEKFIFLDSLSTLLIHNDQDKVLKFMHYLTGKMRISDVSGVMISLHEEIDKELMGKLRRFYDKIVQF
jgi:hypothetical protein